MRFQPCAATPAAEFRPKPPSELPRPSSGRSVSLNCPSRPLGGPLTAYSALGFMRPKRAIQGAKLAQKAKSDTYL